MLIGISKSERYADIVGYTQSELECHFKEYINILSEKLSVSSEELLLGKIQGYYDGFSFDGKTRSIIRIQFLTFSSDSKSVTYATTLTHEPCHQ